MNDDSNVPLRKIVENHGKSIASLLQDIGEKQLRQRKCLSFIERLECLTVERNSCDGPRLMRHNINAFEEREYVALSYTWDNFDEEDPTNGKYKVQNRDRLQFFSSPVRDCVFDRVNSFMQAKGLCRLWIDRHCVKQKTCRKKGACSHKRCDEKKRAVETMDLVYSLSEHPVALLGRPIEWAYELDLLAKVLEGELINESGQVNHDEILQALSLLARITKDRWWTRAWTFQENYRGLRNMTLLIRHPDFLETRKKAHKCFSDVPNELCIGSEQFCRASTELCLWAAKELQRDDIFHHTKEILRVAGKYTLLLDRSMPMTPRVIADLQTRGLKDAWDRLAIIANCCQYTIRMDQTQMQGPKSLSISILAMYLLNGEILFNRSREHSFSILEKPLAGFLEKQAFRGFYAPEGEPWFTFNKRCRFVDVELKPNGVKTRGHLWKLGRIIDPAKFRLLLPESMEKSSFVTKDEKSLVSQLAAELRRLHEITLALHLERFLNYDHTNQGEAFQRETFSEGYMRLMAKELVTAISQGKLLRLGQAWNSEKRKNECSAIFIWDADRTQKPDNKVESDRSKINRKTRGRPDWDFAFTASRPLERGSQNQGTNDLDHHVSLETGSDDWYILESIASLMLVTIQSDCNTNAEKADMGEPGRTPLVVIYWMVHYICNIIKGLKVDMPGADMNEIAFHTLDRYDFPLVPWRNHPYEASLCKGPDHGIAMKFGLVEDGQAFDPVRHIDLSQSTIALDAWVTNSSMQSYSTDSWWEILDIIRNIPLHHPYWKPDPEMGSRVWRIDATPRITPTPPTAEFDIPLLDVELWIGYGSDEQAPSPIICHKCLRVFPQVGLLVKHHREQHHNRAIEGI
ncbi:hypothetical protein FSARC_11036 [Fusarium sarcochroum]|uniref:C2H2-type domain-containing protein n=1 Tax=Fusarium sarcochroum TaxID=1208366 RepID=A0A8H4TI89_9HYPO|nr:hypothetical protein FSARC_11036 [Fusarium sarcochroum]